MSEPFRDLGEAIEDTRFVDVDLALRRGQHIDREDADWYGYLLDAQAVLEPFYRRYGCELIQRPDGYFFLLPTGDKVSKRLLGLPEMIVGQAAALLYLDPSTVESGGVVTKDDLLSHLAAVMGTDALVGVFNPKRKRMDERVAQETVRQRVAEGLRKLAQLGFISLGEDNRVHLRSALMRFADPVRGAGSPRDALERLIARGEISIPADPAAGEADENVTDEQEPGDFGVGSSESSDSESDAFEDVFSDEDSPVGSVDDFLEGDEATDEDSPVGSVDDFLEGDEATDDSSPDEDESDDELLQSDDDWLGDDEPVPPSTNLRKRASLHDTPLSDAEFAPDPDEEIEPPNFEEEPHETHHTSHRLTPPDGEEDELLSELGTELESELDSDPANESKFDDLD
jgi:chromosome partition protein MukE